MSFSPVSISYFTVSIKNRLIFRLLKGIQIIGRGEFVGYIGHYLFSFEKIIDHNGAFCQERDITIVLEGTMYVCCKAKSGYGQ